MKKKLEPLRDPHHIRGKLNCNIWWYENKTGIDIVVDIPPNQPNSFRILWRHLMPAAKRCERKP